jgi:cysteinyl-tRNA synthetase
MAQFNQKSIESFFKKHKVTNADKKAKLLPQVTGIIYDYNMLIIKLEKAGDAYVKKQIIRDIKETEDKLDRIFK